MVIDWARGDELSCWLLRRLTRELRVWHKVVLFLPDRRLHVKNIFEYILNTDFNFFVREETEMRVSGVKIVSS